MKIACVGVLSIIELKNARWNFEKLLLKLHFSFSTLKARKILTSR